MCMSDSWIHGVVGGSEDSQHHVRSSAMLMCYCNDRDVDDLLMTGEQVGQWGFRD